MRRYVPFSRRLIGSSIEDERAVVDVFLLLLRNQGLNHASRGVYPHISDSEESDF